MATFPPLIQIVSAFGGATPATTSPKFGSHRGARGATRVHLVCEASIKRPLVGEGQQEPIWSNNEVSLCSTPPPPPQHAAAADFRCEAAPVQPLFPPSRICKHASAAIAVIADGAVGRAPFEKLMFQKELIKGGGDRREAAGRRRTSDERSAPRLRAKP